MGRGFGITVTVFFLFAGTSAAITLQEIARVQTPTAIVSDGSERLFILQQTGRIRIFNGQRLIRRPFLDLTDEISCCGERGLLGLAFHPDYENNGFFYVDYTRQNGDIVVARFQVSTKRNIARKNSRRVLLIIAHSEFGNHNGGQLQFGPDGFLYIGTGDGGSGGDPHNNAQNLNSLLGKILRIDVDHAKPYSIPSTNPFRNTPNARPEIWAFGLRNPWRFSFDRKTGDLFIGDVGQNDVEEIDLQRAKSRGGKNYGWRRMEGPRCFNPSTNCKTPALRLPILSYTHTGGNCSVIGGFRYRGRQIRSLLGTYLYGDFCSGIIWGAKPKAGGGWRTRTLLDTTSQISSFGQDPDGELYVSDYAGAILKIVP